MGHHINAVILKGECSRQHADEFDLRCIGLPFDLTLLPLHWSYVDHWMEKLSIGGFVSKRPLLNARVVHHIVGAVSSPSAVFAVIETDYFGGHGDQSAAVYRGDEEVMAPKSANRGPINQALKILGVSASLLSDRFMKLGLEKYRDFDDYFENYSNEEET